MTEKPTFGFDVGAEVAIFYGSFAHQNIRYGRIAKYLKNGNFVLEGDNQQFRPSSNNFAHATGQHFVRNHCRVLNEKVKAEAAALKLIHDWRATLRKVNGIKEEDVTAAMLVGLNAIVTLAKGKAEQ